MGISEKTSSLGLLSRVEELGKSFILVASGTVKAIWSMGESS